MRRFAQHCAALDPRTEVPPQALLPHRLQRKPPYLYSDSEILRLIEAAKRLPPVVGKRGSPPGLRAATFSTLLALMAVTGMRTSEPIGLDRDDVDLANGVITIRRTKFGKSRHVPIEHSTQQALGQYRHRRDWLCRHPQSPAFFLSERGTRVTEWALRWTFVKLSREIGLRSPASRRGPRLHDLRHGFALRTLLRWYRDGDDVERQISKLATYLVHAHVNDTYWYLSACPELLQCAARRLEDTSGDQP
jgi:integrase